MVDEGTNVGPDPVKGLIVDPNATPVPLDVRLDLFDWEVGQCAAVGIGRRVPA